MEKCEICGKVFRFITHSHLRTHNLSIRKYLATFPQTKLAWNSGYTKKEYPQMSNSGVKKGQLLGHPPTFSKEILGEERFNRINEERKIKIGKTVREKGISSKGGKVAWESMRKQGKTNKWSPDAKGHNSTKYKGRIPWNKDLTKETNLIIMKQALARTIYFDKPDREKFTPKIRKSIGIRDHFQCQECGDYHDLVIHHKDINPVNNDLSNLILLCRSCHGRIHGKIQYNLAKKI